MTRLTQRIADTITILALVAACIVAGSAIPKAAAIAAQAIQQYERKDNE